MDGDDGLTLVFLGHVGSDGVARANEYEDRVLPLLEAHGGQVRFRGQRLGDDPDHPAEVHVLWFPSHVALDDYLADDRRAALLDEFGEVFDTTLVVPVHPVT